MTSSRGDYGIVTMALGKRQYIEMAKWLGMSLRLNAPRLPSAILTDSSDPDLPKLFTHVIPHRPELGTNVAPKFHLDRISPFTRSLYIDTDCLVINDLSELWQHFHGTYFGMPGWRYLTKHDTDIGVDIPYVLEKFGLDKLAKFNGGCYYFTRSSETTAFFDTARRLLDKAHELRIGSFRGGGFVDEPLFALALGIHGLNMVSTGVRGPWTPLKSTGPIHLDVFARECSFRKEGVMVYPDIVHFPGGYRECYAYHREVWKLQRYFGLPVPSFSERVAMRIKCHGVMTYRRMRENAKRVLGRERTSCMALPDGGVTCK